MDEDDQFELEVPVFIELKQSKFATNDLGVFCTMPLNSDQHLGSFKGKQRKLMAHCADPNYVWTILSSRQIPLFYIDASDPKDSNWLRFIRTTSDASKYNTYCMQQNQEINYFTFKEVQLGDELLTYLPGKKKKTKTKNSVQKSYKLVEAIIEKNEESEKLDKKSNTSELKSLSPSPVSKPEALSIEKPLTTNVTNPTDEIINSKPIVIDIVLKKRSNSSKCPSKFASIDLIIGNNEIHEREIEKCILCTYSTVHAVTNESSLGEHFFQTHFANNSKEIDDIVSNLMNSMLNKVCDESVKQKRLFKCHICQNNHSFTTKTSLIDHLTLIHSELNLFETIKCFFCSDFFKATNCSGFLEHVKLYHKDKAIETKLNLSVAGEETFDLNDFIELEEEGSDTSDKILEAEIIDEDSQSTKSSFPSSVTNESSNKSTSSNEKEKHIDLKRQKSNSTDGDSLNVKQSETEPKRTQSPSQQQSAPAPTKTYTCQLCKKQFEQRNELSKHQCIELNLKLLKKKKDMRKKKWREAHWKRKIDLSYIETTSLTSLSQNIADNLSFCIDGTSEDLKAYSKEVKDYLSTEIGNETQSQMALKSLHLYEKVVPKQLQNPHHNTNLSANSQLIDSQIQKKADSYFVDSIYNENAPNHNSGTKSRTTSTNTTAPNTAYQCKSCRAKCPKLNDFTQHQRESHDMELQTSFDFYSKCTDNLTTYDWSIF